MRRGLKRQLATLLTAVAICRASASGQVLCIRSAQTNYLEGLLASFEAFNETPSLNKTSHAKLWTVAEISGREARINRAPSQCHSRQVSQTWRTSDDVWVPQLVVSRCRKFDVVQQIRRCLSAAIETLSTLLQRLVDSPCFHGTEDPISAACAYEFASSLAEEIQAAAEADSDGSSAEHQYLRPFHVYQQHAELLELRAYDECFVPRAPPPCHLFESIDWLLPTDGATYNLTWKPRTRPVLMLVDLPPALAHRLCMFDVRVDGVLQHSPYPAYSDIFELDALAEGMHRVDLSAVCSDEGTSKVWKPPGRSFTVARDATVKTQDKLVVGLHLFPHDATMAIVNDGRVIAVLELERLLEKRYYGISMHVDRYASIAMCVRPV